MWHAVVLALCADVLSVWLCATRGRSQPRQGTKGEATTSTGRMFPRQETCSGTSGRSHRKYRNHTKPASATDTVGPKFKPTPGSNALLANLRSRCLPRRNFFVKQYKDIKGRLTYRCKNDEEFQGAHEAASRLLQHLGLPSVLLLRMPAWMRMCLTMMA